MMVKQSSGSVQNFIAIIRNSKIYKLHSHLNDGFDNLRVFCKSYKLFACTKTIITILGFQYSICAIDSFKYKRTIILARTESE